MSTYTVVSGDTLWQIARNHGISLKDILAVNPQIINPAFILPGQKINIPATKNPIYTVMSGDTLWQIARNHGIEITDLIKANPQITNLSVIFPGQKINIPSNAEVSDPSDIRNLENEVIRLVNVERVKNGRSSLVENTEVSKVARIKSQDFINNNYFSHNSPTYGTPFEMLNSFGITFTSAAENIASGHKSAAEVMKSWLNSPGHKENILNSKYNQIGVGVAKDKNNNLYWTQLLIKD